MSESSPIVPNCVPAYLEHPKLAEIGEGYMVVEYLDGVSAVIDIDDQARVIDVETRFPGGGLHYESPDEGSPVYIEGGHEDRQENN